MVARILLTFLAALLYGAGLPAATVHPAAAAVLPVAAATAGFDSEPGEYVGQGQAERFTVVERKHYPWGPEGIAFQASQGGETTFEFQFAPPEGERFRVGAYERVERAVFRGDGAAGIDVYGDHRGCDDISGRLLIDDVAYSPAGEITRFAARFEQVCWPQQPSLFGSVTYGATTPYPVRRLTPRTVEWSVPQPVGTGSSRSVAITNEGPSPLVIDRVVPEGDAAVDFPTDDVACRGVTLQPGGSCSVVVRFEPTYPEPTVASLEVYDSTTPTGFTVPVRGQGAPAAGTRTTATVDAEPGGWIGGDDGGIQARYGPGDTYGFSRAPNNMAIVAGDFELDLVLPFGTRFERGTYVDDDPSGYAGQSAAHISLRWPGRACGRVTGRFFVEDVSYGRDDRIDLFAARWEHRCIDDQDSAIWGTFVWNTVGPSPFRLIQPSEALFGTVEVGTRSPEQTIRIVGESAEPVRIQLLQLYGADAASFTLVSTDCPGRTLTPGTSCTAVVSFAPAGRRAFDAGLRLVDDHAPNLTTGRRIPLRGRGGVRSLVITPNEHTFSGTTAGDRSAIKQFDVMSVGELPTTVNGVSIGGPDPEAFAVDDSRCRGRRLEYLETCAVTIRHQPGDATTDRAELTFHSDAIESPQRAQVRGTPTSSGATPSDPPPAAHPPTPAPASSNPPPTSPRSGYWMVDGAGHVHVFGDATHHGHAAVGSGRAVDLEPTATRNGYWIVDASGNVFAFGDAPYHGGSPALGAGEAVTSLSAPPSGGYWLFTSRGRVLSYGGAPLFGDMAGTRLNGPVLDSIPTPSGRGYYMVASDGGVFTFGDAIFAGSMGATRLNAPVQSLVPDPDGSGYWLVARDGGIFSFHAGFYGSMGGTTLNKPITGMVGYPQGYLMVAEDGGIFTFGDATFHGSLGDRPPPAGIVSVAAY